MIKWHALFILITSSLIFMTAAQASSSRGEGVERITLKKTEVIGSQELPRIVSIMSWKKTAPLEVPLLHSDAKMHFNAIDKNEFSRELNYRRQLQQH